MEHVFEPKTYYYTYGVNKPAYQIMPGDSLRAPTLDAGGGDFEGNPVPEEMKHKVPGIIFRESNPLTGPFYVEGAELGDTLAVEIKGIKLNRPTAYSRIGPNFGCLTEEVPGRRFLLNEPLKQRFFYWDLNPEKGTGSLDLPGSKLGRVEIALHPFIGSIGVAPRFGRVEMSLTPGEYGGNMDCVETCQGSTLYLPVHAPGGYLVFGDIHGLPYNFHRGLKKLVQLQRQAQALRYVVKGVKLEHPLVQFLVGLGKLLALFVESRDFFLQVFLRLRHENTFL